MLRATSESDITSLAPSSPSRALYYVQSPSRDSHDGDKSSASMHATPAFNSPMDSPSHPSLSGGGRHSRTSSGSRFSGILRSSSARKGGRKRNDKGWPECGAVMEEGSYDEFQIDKGLTRRNQALVALCGFVFLFTIFCLIIWGASRPYKPEIAMKSLVVHSFYTGEGLDFSGVPTKLLTINGSLRINVNNPATFFGIHVSSSSITLMYSEITVAAGQLKKYYQPRKSHRTVTMNLRGNKVPLYGASSSLVASNNQGEVPFILKLGLRSSGRVVGRLVRTTHRLQVSCAITINMSTARPIKFKKDSCSYRS